MATISTTPKGAALSSNDTLLTGPELMDEIIQHPTLDILLARDPHAKPFSDADLMALIMASRAERTMFNIREEKKKAKKEGIEE